MLFLATSCAPQGKAPPRHADVDAELRQATQRYARLVLHMDNAGIAALFTEDGQLVTQGQKPIEGPKEIESFLEKFKQYHVQAESLETQAVTGNADSGQVTGRYHQSVRLPAGNVVDVHGAFTADWVRGSDDVWRMRRMTAIPDQQGD